MTEKTRTYSVYRISFVKGRITETGERMSRAYHSDGVMEEVPFVLKSVVPEWYKYDQEGKALARRILSLRLPDDVYHSVNDWMRKNIVLSKPEREIDAHVYSHIKNVKSSTSKEIAKHLGEKVPTVTASLRALYNKGLVGKKRKFCEAHLVFDRRSGVRLSFIISELSFISNGKREKELSRERFSDYCSPRCHHNRNHNRSRIFSSCWKSNYNYQHYKLTLTMELRKSSDQHQLYERGQWLLQQIR